MRMLLGLLLVIVAMPLIAAEPDTYCKEAKELASVTSQLPGYVIASETETPAKLISPMKFKPFGVLKASRGLPVCIALVVDETGKVLDAAAYSPKRVALSRQERAILLAQKYSPSQQGSAAVRSIVLMKAWAD